MNDVEKQPKDGSLDQSPADEVDKVSNYGKRPWRSLVTCSFNPDSAFDSLLQGNGNMPLLQPVLVFLLGAMVFTWLNLGEYMDMAMEQISKTPDISPEAIEIALKFARGSAVAGSGAAVVIIFIIGLALAFIGLFFGSPASLRQLSSLAGYSITFPFLMKNTLQTILLKLVPSLSPQLISTSAALFISPDQAGTFVYSLLSSLDFFTIWSLVIMIIGYAKITGFSKKKSAAILVTAWVAFIVGSAALSMRAMKAFTFGQ